MQTIYTDEQHLFMYYFFDREVSHDYFTYVCILSLGSIVVDVVYRFKSIISFWNNNKMGILTDVPTRAIVIGGYCSKMLDTSLYSQYIAV